MVVTEQKARDKILAELEPYRRVFLVGCGDCATTCRTGGEREIEEMRKALEEAGHEVTGALVPEVGCLLPKVKRVAREQREALEKSDAVLVLSCGLGNQVMTEVGGCWVVPGCDTLFLGSQWKIEMTPAGIENVFAEKCRLCGECILDLTGGLCPHTLCAKSMLNGPCGGTKPDGSCETGNDQPCGWLTIYQRLEKIGRLDLMKAVIAPRDWGRRKKPEQARRPL